MPTPLPVRSLRPVTIDVVMQMFPEPDARKNVGKYFGKINQALIDFKLTTPQMHLVAYATIRAESAGFAPITEGKSQYNTLTIPVEFKGGGEMNLYDFRRKLGNNEFGDGKKYIGRGFVQLTGKANYDIHGAQIGNHQLVANPEQANDPDTAAKLLASFINIKRSVIEKAILKFDFYEARKAVNGGSHGLDKFIKAYIDGYLRIGGTINYENA